MSTGEPQSRSASTPAAALVERLLAGGARSSTAPPPGADADVAVRVDQPGHQPAAAADRLGARTGSKVNRPSRTQTSRCSPSGSTHARQVERRRSPAGPLVPELVEVQLGEVRQPLSGRQAGHGGSAGIPGGRPWGRPGAPMGRRAGAAFGRPLPFLPFFDCACICRPRAFFDIGPMPGRPMLPAIWLIIFWAWVKRSSSWLTSVTLTPGAVGDPHPPRGVDDLRS